MSSDLSGEITAVATAVLALFAVITAVLAGLAFRKQAREVGAVERQLELQRQQFADQLAERHRAQAAHIFIWNVRDIPRAEGTNLVNHVERVVAHVKNSSEQPIYGLCVDWREPSLWEGRHELEVLMPDGQQEFRVEFPQVDDHPASQLRLLLTALNDIGPPLHFRDAAGAYWCLHNKGQLTEESGPFELDQEKH